MLKNSTTRERLRLMGDHPGSVRVWAWLNVVIAHWYGRPTGPAARTIWRLTDQVLDELGAAAKFSFVHLVANQIAMPDAETRAVIVESSKAHGPRLVLSAIVVNGTGFWASALRGVATSISMLIPTVRMRICGDPSELVPWFPTEHARHTGVSLDADTFVSLLNTAQVQSADLTHASNS